MRRKKNDYRAFLKKSGFKAMEGKQVSISKETHDKVAMIVRWLVMVKSQWLTSLRTW